MEILRFQTQPGRETGLALMPHLQTLLAPGFPFWPVNLATCSPSSEAGSLFQVAGLDFCEGP